LRNDLAFHGEREEEGVPKVNLEEGLSQVADFWRPKIIAALNDYKVQLVKVQGEWVWHKHDNTDELFLVIAGRLTMQMRGGDVELEPGDLLVVPRGVEHCPMASEVCQLLLIEPFGTPNTGDVGGERTAPEERLGEEPTS
jgi:mannose-6-phosphate isomerase-like protein (cupin superfamily)